MKYTYWITINDQKYASGLSYHMVRKMVRELCAKDDDSILVIEYGNDQTGRCIDSICAYRFAN